MKRIIYAQGNRSRRPWLSSLISTRGGNEKKSKPLDGIIGLVGLLFIVGVLIGSTIVYRMDKNLYQYFCVIIEEMVNANKESQWYQHLYSIALPSIGYIALLFLCGFCVIAQPIILAIPLFKGISFGLLQVGMISTIVERKEIITYVLTIPVDLVICIILFFTCKQSFYLSRKFWSKAHLGSENVTKEEEINLHSYIIKFVAYIIITLLFCALHATIYSVGSMFQ